MHVWVLLLLWSASGLDERADFQKGRALYEDLEFESALVEFKSAAAAPDLSTEERARVLVWVGICAASVGDLVGARAAVEEAFAADADVAVPDYAPPKLREFFDEVRAEREAAAMPAAQAPPSEPVVTDATQDEAEVNPADPMPSWLLLSGVGAVTGGVLVVGLGAAVAGLAAVDFGQATDTNAVQLSALAAQDRFNVEAGVAGACAAAGVLVAGAGAGLIAWDLAGAE